MNIGRTIMPLYAVFMLRCTGPQVLNFDHQCAVIINPSFNDSLKFTDPCLETFGFKFHLLRGKKIQKHAPQNRSSQQKQRSLEILFKKFQKYFRIFIHTEKNLKNTPMA